MITQSIYDHIRQFVPEADLLLNEPLNCHTTFKVGGEADLFINISDKEQLVRLIPFLRKLEIDFFILGNGSNILVGDKGFRGAILHIGEGMSEITVKKNIITAGAGALLSSVANFAAQQNLTGMEFASGIPGTIGGGVVMNAGAFEGEMAMITESVLIMNEAGEMMELNNEAMEFGYRMSVVKKRPHVVLSVTLRLAPGKPEEIKQKLSELAGKRREKQPLEYASAGSTFKRPKGHFAGKLIMDAGLRGFKIGGAQVSEKHCGFVVNKGNATATDILEVIKEVQDRVYDRFDVTLEPEIIYLGDF
jgi:UDP-N-acetylmuramate dehydrogenase